MNRFLTPIALLALVAAASAQESKTLTQADQGRTLVLDSNGKMRVLQAGTGPQAATRFVRAPLAIAQGGSKDDERIRELSRKLAELSKELAELMKSRGMAGEHSLAPVKGMDQPKIIELVQKSKGMQGDMIFKMEPGMEGLHKLSPKFKPQGGEMYEYRYEITGKPKKEPVKRFFDEKMFQTPEPKQKSKVKKEGVWSTQGGQYKIVIDEAMKGHQIDIEKTMKGPGQYKIVIDKAMKEGALSQEHKIAMEKAIKQGGISKEHQIEMDRAMKLQGQAMKEVEIVLKRTQAERELKTSDLHRAEVAKTSSSNTSALMHKIAALEAQIKALKEENKRLREKHSVPPPQVEVRSKRIR